MSEQRTQVEITDQELFTIKGERGDLAARVELRSYKEHPMSQPDSPFQRAKMFFGEVDNQGKFHPGISMQSDLAGKIQQLIVLAYEKFRQMTITADARYQELRDAKRSSNGGPKMDDFRHTGKTDRTRRKERERRDRGDR